MKLLLDAPDPKIAAALGRHDVEIAADLEDFLRLSEIARFDVVLVHRPELAARVRGRAAVIVITDPGDVEARVRALEVGADDAFDAGFAPSQMVARVGAVARRTAAIARPLAPITIDGCTLDLDRGSARRGEREIELSGREIELLRWLHRHAGRIVGRAELLEHVWGVAPSNTTRAIDVAVAALRAKLERDPKSPAIVVSVKGVGYRWGGA